MTEVFEKMSGKLPAHTGFNFTSTLHKDTYPAIDPSTKSDLSGKHVFITGASKGIGRATSIAYAKAGAEAIGIAARSNLSSLEEEMKKAATSAGKKVPKILALSLDVLDLKSIEAAVAEFEKAFGRLDILINNAGYLEIFTPIADSDPDDYWRTWNMNMRGPYLMTRAFLPLLLKGGDMQIVNLSSIGAHNLRPGASGYQTTKFALLKFTEFINAEYGDKGVMAFAVHPGGVMTDMGARMPKEAHGILTDTPEVAGDTIVFLTQEKREWLAGRYVSCTWDMPEFLAMKDEIVKGDKLKMRMVV
ncbi:MAG: hypothetical protein M1827_001988 [Pycnora praestabilis]|nr:MAG: hypothetical protein M1827_001988 [Pycnora praestabilis]